MLATRQKKKEEKNQLVFAEGKRLCSMKCFGSFPLVPGARMGDKSQEEQGS
jgi:hypothetical protein